MATPIQNAIVLLNIARDELERELWHRGAHYETTPSIPTAHLSEIVEERALTDLLTGVLNKVIPHVATPIGVYTREALHYFIATSMAVTYYLVARRWSELWQRPWLYGPLYGVLLYGIMNYIVVPLSAANPGSRDLVWVLLSIAVHAFLIGTPCALFARRAMLAGRPATSNV